MVSFTNNTFHNSQILLSNKVIRYASWSSHFVYGCAIASCLATFIPSHISQKLINVAIAPVLFAVSNRLDRLALYADGYGSIGEAQSHIQYRNWLDASLQPPKREIQVAPPAEPIAAVKFADIREALKKPHIMLLGETGSGKSVLCKYFASELKIPCIALDPHASPNDWQGARVIGQGRDYQAIGKELALLVALMDYRYKQRDKGISQFAPLGVILDEFPAVSSELGKDASNPVKLIVREARKVNIKLILLAQGSEVRTLGIEGEGSLRESFAVVSLGKFATDRAKGIKDKAMIEAIAMQSRPAMIDDMPSNIPVIPDSVALPVLPLPSDYQMLIADNAIAPDIEPIDRPHNQQSALTAPALTTSAPSITNQQSATLSAPLTAIVDYAKKKDEFISARQVQSGIAIFKSAKAPEIREYFKYLATLGYGVTRGDSDTLEFSAG